MSVHIKKKNLDLRTERKWRKYSARYISTVFMTLISLTYGELLYAQNLIGQHVALVGEWNDAYIGVKELQCQDLDEDDMEAHELVERADDIDMDEMYGYPCKLIIPISKVEMISHKSSK